MCHSYDEGELGCEKGVGTGAWENMSVYLSALVRKKGIADNFSLGIITIYGRNNL